MIKKVLSLYLRYRRCKMLKRLLKSGIVTVNTESATIARMADSLIHYIDTGEYDKGRAYPNGYRSAT